MRGREVIIKDTHRGLRYRDGVMTGVLEAGRHTVPLQAYSMHPALLRLQELETLRELSQVANARIYIGFEKHLPVEANGRRDE
jgi:hypothetical protein